MWSPTTPKEKKNTADDNKNKEEVTDCYCSDSSSARGGSVEQQRQQTTLSNSKSKPPQNKFGGKLSKDHQDAGVDDNNTAQGGADGGNKKGFVVAETTDSGFISGPLTEPLDYSDEEEKTVEDNNATDSSASNATAATTETPSGRGDTNRGTKTQIDECIDSGVIEFADYEAETDEAEVENVVDADVAETEKALLSNQVERESTSKSTVATKSKTTLTPASNKPTASNTTEEEKDTMLVKHIVVGSSTEWTCDAPNSNNLNSSSSGITQNAPTTTLSSQLSSANLQTNRAADLAAGAAAAALSRTSSFPWEQFYKQNDDGDTALHLACIAGCIDVITALIRMAPHPCLLNIRNDDAQTPLHLAALTAQPNVLRILLLAGAEPTIRDRHGNTALHLACLSGEIQCVRALTETFAASEIHEAHRQYGHRSNDKAVSSLSYARLPSDLEIRNYDGERCVHLASQGGHIDVLRILVANGADINAREGKSGRTPLHIAIECRNEDLANFLLDECEKLNLETATYAGLTAYQIAQILNNAPMQNILEKRGAEPLTPPDSDYDSEDELDDSKVSVCC